MILEAFPLKDKNALGWSRQPQIFVESDPGMENVNAGISPGGFPRIRNFMKRLSLLCPVAILLLAAFAQEDGPSGFEHWTPASFTKYAQKMHQDATSDPHHFAVELLGDFPNDSSMLVHRESDGQAEWHETQADVFLVLSGSATLVVGGTLVDGETVGPHEKRSGAIQGGVRQKLSAGDVVRIPARQPHQLSLEGSPELNYFVVKVKGY